MQIQETREPPPYSPEQSQQPLQGPGHRYELPLMEKLGAGDKSLALCRLLRYLTGSDRGSVVVWLSNSEIGKAKEETVFMRAMVQGYILYLLSPWSMV